MPRRDKATRRPVAVHELAGLIMAANARMRASFEDVCARHELTAQQARTLLALKQQAPMRSLADHLRCDASNVTGIADRLEGRGLVRREAAEGDRRVKLLALTATGESVRDDLERAILRQSPVMTMLTDDERETLRGLLAKVAEAGSDRVGLAP